MAYGDVQNSQAPNSYDIYYLQLARRFFLFLRDADMTMNSTQISLIKTMINAYCPSTCVSKCEIDMLGLGKSGWTHLIGWMAGWNGILQ